MAKRIEVNPGIHGEFARGDLQVRCIADIDRIIYAVQQKSLVHHTRSKRRAILQRAVIAALKRADEAPKARYQAAKPQAIANAFTITRSIFASVKVSTLNASRLRCSACERRQSNATQSRN